jgi:hypothetical protein
MIEPYDQQLHVTSTNFGFRDYYKVPISTHQPYLSNVFTSQASGHEISMISIPTYSKNDTMTGIWLGAMNLAQISSKLNSEYLGTTSLIAILDQNGNVAAQSGGYKTAVQLQDLDMYKLGLNGQSDSVVTDINGTKMFVFYLPIKTFSGTWAMLVLRPYDQSFAGSTTTREVEAVAVSSLVIVSVIFVLSARKSRIL